MLAGPAAAAPVGFTQIGPGKPLSIEIRHFYNGKNPRYGSKKDMLLTTATKATHEFQPAARGINLIREDVPRYSQVDIVHASESGTPVVFYSPAMLDSSVVVTMESFLNSFDKSLFDTLSSLAKAAGGIPLFAGASAILHTAGVALDLAGRLGEAVFDGAANFFASEEINFNKPGVVPTAAGYLVLVQDRDEQELSKLCELGDRGRLVLRGTEQPYNGDLPYATLAVDGRKRDELKEFQPTKAAGDLINRFLGDTSDQEEVGSILIDALTLASDAKYRREADELQERIASATSDDERAALQARHAAVIKNITNKLLKPVAK